MIISSPHQDLDRRPGQEASDGPNLFLNLVHRHPVRVEALGVVVQLEAINYGECQRLKLEFSSFVCHRYHIFDKYFYQPYRLFSFGQKRGERELLLFGSW